MYFQNINLSSSKQQFIVDSKISFLTTKLRTIISIARIELLSSSVYLINLEEIERLQKIRSIVQSFINEIVAITKFPFLTSIHFSPSNLKFHFPAKFPTEASIDPFQRRRSILKRLLKRRIRLTRIPRTR